MLNKCLETEETCKDAREASGLLGKSMLEQNTVRDRTELGVAKKCLVST